MPKFYKTASVPYTSKELFDLVADVAKYPDFLPFCTKTTIHESSETHMVADMHIGYKSFSGAFQSKVNKNAPYSLTMEQQHGSLKYLRSCWLFKDHMATLQKTPPILQTSTSVLQSQCTVEFMIDFEPSSWMIGKLITPIMNEMGEVMMQSFLNRAKVIYRP